MTSHEIEQHVKAIFENFSKEEFVYDVLLAYGISKTTVTRLKNGDFNLSKNAEEILLKKKLFFKPVETNQLLSTLDAIANEEKVLKHKPRFAILTDFETLVARDMKLGRNLDIPIIDLPKYFSFFLPLAGAEAYHHTNDNEADRNAAYKMGELYDLLAETNKYDFTDAKIVHDLHLFLSRLLFCFFAEDTDIFKEEGIFTNTLKQHCRPDGSDADQFLNRLFKRLNTEDIEALPDYLARFEYVNGGLFKDEIASPKFNTKAFSTLVALGELQWKNINPDIFGSMIQAVVRNVDDDNTKHYTSVPNILKVIRPLFLDELEAEFEKAEDSIPQLRRLINRMAKMKFFDPACGSGNFLIIAYKEIRLLEIKILQRIIELSPKPEMQWTAITLSQFYGIELDDFAHEMAILSLWLSEHQMNLVFDDKLAGYGQSNDILPLKQAGKIVQGNAARLDWKEVCPISDKEEVYILGNPPYLGSNLHSDEQRDDMKRVFNEDSLDRLDYIGTWFMLAAMYIHNTSSKSAFVTTNSITQGVQVPFLWRRIFDKNIFIYFAVKSFKWTNNAKGNAGVSVAIIGLSFAKTENVILYDNNIAEKVKSISPYLIKNTNVIVFPSSQPAKGFPPLVMGNKPADNGNLILTKKDADELIQAYPSSKKFVKRFINADDFINGNYRYCLWIESKNEAEAKAIPPIKKRTENLRKFRLESKAKSTRDYAANDYLFRQMCYKETDGIVVPSVSSERRSYIPLGYIDKNTIVSNATSIIYDAQPWLFAVITSRMHMVWVRAVGGRLKTDYRYSAKLCYNTFPFPDISTKQKENLSLYVFAILDERAKYTGKTMAQLYNPDTMPKGLKDAHEALDRAVEDIYRMGHPFKSDTERLEHLFKLYEEMTKKDTLFAKQKPPRKQRGKKKEA